MLKIHFTLIFRRLAASFILLFSLIFSSFFLLELLLQKNHLTLTTSFWLFIDLFITRFDFLCPLASLLAILYTITTLKIHNEILALSSIGIKKKTILAPFITFSLLLTLLTYFHLQYILPLSHPSETLVKSKPPSHTDLEVRHLQDGTRCAFRTAEGSIIDLYWIQSFDTIWHAEVATKEGDEWVGKYVDLFQKNETGFFEKKESFETHLFPFKELLSAPFGLVEDKTKSIGELYSISSQDKASAYFQALLCRKLITPWISSFLMTAFLPILFRFSRSFRPFSLFATGLLSFILFEAVIKSMHVLGENYILSPIIGVILTPLALQGIFTYRLCKS